MKTTGVIIARFQTPSLNDGHCALITHVREKHPQVVVVLGVSPVKGSTINPLDFNTRERMVKKAFPDVTVLPCPDVRKDDVWSAKLDHLLSATFANEKFTLYGSRERFIRHYSGKNEVKEIAETADLKGAAPGNQISQKVLDTEDFRRGMIYAYANLYPKVYPTLDIALFRNDYTSLLLGRRDVEGQWRLPGGFSDPDDEDYESAALRELQEECGSIEVGGMKYEKSFKVDDWRYRNETDKIITLLFSCSHLFGKPLGNDDIDEVKWFDVTDLPGMMEQRHIVEEHVPHLQFLFNKYKK